MTEILKFLGTFIVMLSYCAKFAKVFLDTSFKCNLVEGLFTSSKNYDWKSKFMYLGSFLGKSPSKTM